MLLQLNNLIIVFLSFKLVKSILGNLLVLRFLCDFFKRKSFFIRIFAHLLFDDICHHGFLEQGRLLLLFQCFNGGDFSFFCVLSSHSAILWILRRTCAHLSYFLEGFRHLSNILRSLSLTIFLTIRLIYCFNPSDLFSSIKLFNL